MRWLNNVGSKLRVCAKCAQLRHYRSVVQQARCYQQGQTLQGYTIQKVAPVDELALTAVFLRHDKTGAEHLHIARDDTDNAFGVGFRTTPMDSTGVPHILEHTALCGSAKFPVRDPFFKMLNRSLSTFMNAMTASDWTIYPFSTQNAQDYENLMKIYLDSAFFPKLSEQDFRQEGWRLENENLSDPSSPITFKGVVYNEMKGVYTSSQNIFHIKHQNLLLPSHTYGICSGGDPKHITELSWQHLRDFHASHYHPSNARFYTYGTFPLERHLELIEENVLCRYDKIDVNTSVPPEKRWTEPREHEMSCAPDPMAADPQKQTTVAVSYLLGDITDVHETFVLKLLSSLLTSGEKAPFYKSLLSANIGSDFSPVIGYAGETKDVYFSVGLQGIHREDVEKVKTIIEQTLTGVIEEGFEQERVAALLHQIELSQKQQSTKFGLNLGVALMSPWNHGADPTELLHVQKCVDHFKTCLQNNPRYLQDKVKYYLKDNTHRLTLVMSPDDKYDEKVHEEEETRLHRMLEQLTPDDRQKIHTDGVRLAEAQMQEEDLSCLPSLKVSDIEPRLPAVTTDTIYADNTPVQISEQPTSGISYFRAISNMQYLDENLKPYVPLFCSIVTKMGAGGMDFQELSQQIDMHTGGLSAGVHVSDHHTQPKTFEEAVIFSSFCLDRNTEKMFELWTEIFHRLDMSDLNRLATLVHMSAAELANSIVGAGHSYAMGHASSYVTPAAQLREHMSGITQVSLMKQLAELQDLTTVIAHLKDIAHHVLNRNNLRCALNATPEALPSFMKATEHFVQDLTHSTKLAETDCEIYTQKKDFHPQSKRMHFELPFQVNYASRSICTVPYTHKDFASLRILARLMTNKYLHREVREKGGAYGGGASGNSPGLFNFYSYRDPNSLSTLCVFDGAVHWAVEGKYSQQDIDEAKLAIFAQTDAPVSPGDRGLRQFLVGINDEMRQEHREQLFDVQKDNLLAVANRYLSEDQRVSAVALLGPENSATKEDECWTVRKG